MINKSFCMSAILDKKEMINGAIEIWWLYQWWFFSYFRALVGFF